MKIKMTDSIMGLRTVEWKDNSVVMIDKIRLPNELGISRSHISRWLHERM